MHATSALYWLPAFAKYWSAQAWKHVSAAPPVFPSHARTQTMLSEHPGVHAHWVVTSQHLLSRQAPQAGERPNPLQPPPSPFGEFEASGPGPKRVPLLPESTA
jgi:hypothetical protein